MASVEQLIFEIIGRDKSASKAFDDLRRSVDSSSGSVDKNTQALQKNQQAQTSAMGAAAGVGLAFSAMSSPIASAAAGIIAYGTIAAPTILKVKTALSGPGGLVAAWGTLDNRQRNMALGVQALSGRYHDLALAMEPRVAQTFGTALGIVNKSLGPFGQLAGNAGTALEQFLVQFSQDAGLSQFITFMAHEAGPAIKLLGTDITNISHAVFALLQSWGGLGLAELKLVTAVVTGITGSLSWLAEHAPGITSAAIAVGGIALALSKMGLASKALEITGIASIAGQMTGFAGATRGATLAEKGLLATTTVLEAISPWAWVAIGAAALAFLADKVITSKTQVQSLVDEMAKANGATGLNVAGYQRLSDALGKASQDYAGLIRNVSTAGAKYGGLQHDTAQLTGAQKAAAQMASSLAGSVQALAGKYGISDEQAKGLIIHAGEVNDILKAGGKITPQAAKAIDDYAKSNQRARGPASQLAADIADYSNKTLTATDRTKALSDALNAFFNPAVTADQAVITLKNDQVTLAKALKASGGQTGLLTQKQRDARGAFDTYINDVANAAQKSFDATGKTRDYSKVINDALPFLRAAAGGNKTLRAEIQKLIDTERGIKSEKVSIHVSGTGAYVITQGGGPPHIKPPGQGQAARGLFIGHGTPGVDDQLIRAQRGELVVPTNLVAAGAVDHLKGMIPGFAAGGVVGNYRDGIGGLPPWLLRENAATLKAIENATAAAAFRAMQIPVFPGGGFGGAGTPGGGSAAANYALARQLFPWPMSMFPAFNAVEMREAGYSMTALNPSGAYGMAQFINGPSEYYQYGGNPNTAAGQLVAMFNYIRQRYTTPIGAEAHEQAFGWYDNGGVLKPGPNYMWNGTGRAEHLVPADRGTVVNISVNVAPMAHPAEIGRVLVEYIQQYAKRSGPIRLNVRS